MKSRALVGAIASACCIGPIAAVAGTDADSSLIGVQQKFGVYGRENSLPLCDWSTEERTLLQFIADNNNYLSWTCRKAGGGNDSCSWSASYAPTNTSYRVLPRDIANTGGDSLAWPDGSGVYNMWHQQCQRPTKSTSNRHQVASTSVVGTREPGGNVCAASGFDDPKPWADVILAEVDGGTVEHLDPAYVRGSVKLALPSSGMDRMVDDLEVAVQALVDGVWLDAEVTVATVESFQQTFEVDAIVDPLVDVRLQVRGRKRCLTQDRFTGYDLRDARIFVETCVPDQSNPGECL